MRVTVALLRRAREDQLVYAGRNLDAHRGVPNLYLERLPLEEIRAALDQGVGRHPLWNEVLDIAPDEPRRRLSIPALWIHATGLGRPKRAFRRQFEEVFANLKTLEIDCGHWIPEERPQELAAALGEFLES
ncbi:MAG: alpha/beta fold hydrolase [Candidatus Binatia bacterium]